ncbi:hypothetical protein SASPL_141880 [Salvia splendens]|uniref:Mediator of RNA polymerase II transcription subunit 6 n=1 Tax=Salvia splendens TaxID=180675 RepID=A0A8X8Z8K1_SALSN|nr:hypothetical protein SASPL_141880 [Salvia splendens]
MATTPMIPPPADGTMATPPPGTDMTSICFRDQLWLNTYPLDRNLVFDYFALSPPSTTIRAIMSSFGSALFTPSTSLTSLAFVASSHVFGCMHIATISNFLILKFLLWDFEFLDVHKFEMGRALYHISKAFNTAASKLEKIGYVDAENESASSEPKAPKETINFKELKRVDHILASLQRKLPPAPPPPPFPEGYAPPTPEGEKSSDTQQEQLATVDPIIDQGPSKRMKI